MRGKWLETYGGNDLYVEIGCGKGSFTVESAKTNPDILHVALEKSANAMIIAMEHAEAEMLQNLRFINSLAEFMQSMFAKDEVSRIYINFCDPWPANRHIKRRLTHRNYLELYKQFLRKGGGIFFKTDNLPLFEYSIREFEYSGYTLPELIYDLHKEGPIGIMTDYERKFHDLGLPIYFAEAVLI